jgi:hypothetical protein
MSAMSDKFISDVIRDIAELPDKTSPEDQPEMMLVSTAELRAILINNFQRVGLAAANQSQLYDT